MRLSDISVVAALIMCLVTAAPSKAGNDTTSKKTKLDVICQQSKITMYNITKRQCGNTKGIGYFGENIRKYGDKDMGTIAVSHDLLKRGLSENKVVYVEGFGFKKVRDRTGGRIKNHLDIYSTDIKKSVKFGLQRRKIIWVNGKIDPEKEKEILKEYATRNGASPGG